MKPHGGHNAGGTLPRCPSKISHTLCDSIVSRSGLRLREPPPHDPLLAQVDEDGIGQGIRSRKVRNTSCLLRSQDRRSCTKKSSHTPLRVLWRMTIFAETRSPPCSTRSFSLRKRPPSCGSAILAHRWTLGSHQLAFSATYMEGSVRRH